MYWKYENEEEEKRTKGMRVRERERMRKKIRRFDVIPLIQECVILILWQYLEARTYLQLK